MREGISVRNMWGCPNNCLCPKDLEICPNCKVHVIRGMTGSQHAELDRKLMEALEIEN